MLSIQDVGLSIFGDTPKKLYILGGPEYGIKEKYIEILITKIGPKIEYDNVADVIQLMSTYHLIPLDPQVYVVRYDKNFISNLNKDLTEKVLNLKTIGTLVLIYEDDKDIHKLDKHFPDNTAVINPIDDKHMSKHLRQDFPDLDKQTIEAVVQVAENYYQAKNICRCLFVVQDKIKLTKQQIVSLFDLKTTYSNEALQIAIANRDFRSLIDIAEHYESDPQLILYQILRVMVEIDKCFDGKYVNSPIKKYAKNWTRPDVYYMFQHTYEAIKALRSGCTVDIQDLIVYLGALMKFKNIPDMGLLK